MTPALSPALCEDVGLRVVSAGGRFRLGTPAAESLQTARATLNGARRGIVEFGIATDHQIDELLESLSAAAQQQYRGVVGPLGVMCVAQAP